MTPFGYPLELFHCLLDEQPHYLVPTRLLGRQNPAANLMVNPNCWFSWHGPLPVEKGVRAAFAENLGPSEHMVWVDCPGNDTMWPFWVGTGYFNYLSDMTPGAPVEIDLPEQALWVLRAANILVDPTEERKRRLAWLRKVQENAPLWHHGYVSLDGLIHPFHIGALRRYYRYHARTGSFALGDTQVAGRFAAHNEAVARFYHHQLAGVVSDIVSRLVKPSYAYFVAYQSESELGWHTEREQCKYSLSLCIDASPEPQDQNPCPLHFQTSDGLVRIWQYIGDGLLYLGRKIPHAQERLPYGYTTSSLLFHYVDEQYDGPLD
jgi:hypothetical protein